MKNIKELFLKEKQITDVLEWDDEHFKGIHHVAVQWDDGTQDLMSTAMERKLALEIKRQATEINGLNSWCDGKQEEEDRWESDVRTLCLLADGEELDHECDPIECLKESIKELQNDNLCGFEEKT